MATTSTLPTLDPSLASYLQSLDIGSAGLAHLLDASAGGLLGAVPPAGQYTTSLDYTTLYPALAAQYVTEVIHTYEAQLGPAPELYQAAQQAGYLTAEQVAALSSHTMTTTGTLQDKFERQGGLRALAGPYNAERAQLLEQALSDMHQAAQKASTDAYQLAAKSTDSRINALTNAGQIGTNLSGQGVSRRNAQTAAEAGGGEEQSFPAPPTPDQPSLWEKILPSLITSLVGGGLGYLTRPHAATPEERAQEQQRFADEQARLKASSAERSAILASPGYNVPDRPQGMSEHGGGVGINESAALPASNPYGAAAPTYAPQPAPATPSYSWQSPVSNYQDAYGGQAYEPAYSYDNGGSSYQDAYGGQAYEPAYSYDNGGGYYDDPYQGYYGGDSGGGSYYPSSDSYYQEYY